MAASARPDPASQEPPEPERRKPDCRAAGWADVRRAMVTEAAAVGLAAAEVARRPGDQAALDMLELAVSVMQAMGDLGRRLAWDEQVLEQERRRAFDEGFAAGHALRGRLSVVSSSG